MEWLIDNIGAVVAVVGGLAGIYAAISSKLSNLETEIKGLRRDVEKHNNGIERIYELEQQTAVQDQRITASEARIKRLEGAA